jgi:hypothetical protein
MISIDSRELILTDRWLRGNSYRAGPTVRAETMSHSYETGRAVADFGSKQPHELLLMLGGLLAVLLTLAKYGIQWVTPPGIAQSQYATIATALILNVVLGAALWASSAITRKNLMNGAIVAGVISVILIYFGGQSGQIGGVVGIFGAILAAAKPYLPWSRD